MSCHHCEHCGGCRNQARHNPDKIIRSVKDEKYALVDAETRYRIETGTMRTDVITKDDWVVIGGEAPEEPSLGDQILQSDFGVEHWGAPPVGGILAGGRVIAQYVSQSGLGPRMRLPPFRLGLMWIRVS